jgi:hypothetical protein
VSELLEAIERVTGLISGPRADAREVAAELGEAFGPVASVDVVAVPDSDDVSHVDLELREPEPASTLRDALGEADEPPRVHFDSPRSLMWMRPETAVIARLQRGDEELVQRVTVRRDVV